MDSYYDSEEADVADIIRKLELRRSVSSYPEISTQCQNELCRCQHLLYSEKALAKWNN